VTFAALLSWIAFNAFILAMPAVDLGLFRRRLHKVSIRKSLIWSGIWIA